MRSPLTETIQRVNGMISYVRENLSTDEYMLFLDLLAPEPEPEVKPAKKKVTTERKGQCAACDHLKTHPVHTQENRTGYHVYQPTRSRRAASLAEQIKSTSKPAPHLGEGPVCQVCAHTEDYEDHAQPSPHYHEFQPPKSNAASGGD